MLRSTYPQQKGLTLIEVLVGIAIGMLVILAAGSVIIVGNKHQRSTVASSNLGQDSTFIHGLWDQSIRSAGTGFLHGNNWSPLGCTLNATFKNKVLLPLPATAPEFLGDILSSNKIPLAPVLIANGINDNNVIIAMSGSQQIGGAPQEIIDSDSSGTALTVNTSVGLKKDEFIIINSADSLTDCYVSQVNSISGNALFLSTDYQPKSGEENPSATSPISSLVQEPAFFSTLGQVDNGTLDMSAFGVNAQGELQQFNLISQETPDTLVSNVVAMYAIYGVDDGSGSMTWQLPSGDYDFSAILAKSRAEKSALLRNITAIRISLLIKNPQLQGEEVTEASITHFADALPSGNIKTSISNSNKKYNHQLFEFTIPLRNALFARNLVNAD